jgi:putative peptide zinc metalloprotease protein
VRQDLVVVVVIGIGALLVARVRAVALAHPGTRDELRLVDSALAGVRHTNGPSAGGGDLLARAQLIGYARLTGAFDRSGTALGAGRELAVLAAAVLVFCLLTLAAARRLPPAAVGLPMLAVLVMGPAAITFATVGPGLIGAAWAASGALVLAFARGGPAAVLGVLALVVAVATEPLTAVPLAVGTAVQLGSGRIRGRRSGRHHPPPSSLARRFFLRSPRWLPAALLVVAGIAGILGGGGGGASVPVDGSEATVLVLLGALLVVAGALVRHLRPVAAATGSALILAVLPWPGAGSALPLAAAAMVLLGTCLTDALIGVPVDQRAHPLVRAALAVPALVLVLVGALFQPSSTGPDATAAAASSATAAVVGR